MSRAPRASDPRRPADAWACARRASPQSVSWLTLPATFAAILLTATGCSMQRQYTPQVDTAALDGTTFLHYLGTVPVVSYEEGCRAILLAADGEERFTSHEQRQMELSRRGVVREAWQLGPDHVLDKGTLAFMAMKTCRLPASVNTMLLGSWGLGDRRYALKEAVAAELMTYDATYRAVRGGELVATLGRIDEYMARQGLYEWSQPEVDGPEDITPPIPPGEGTAPDG